MFKAKLHIPLVLSLLCPGIGQLVQRRWLAGLFYLLLFLALCIALITFVTGMMATNLDAAMSFVNNEPNKDFATGSKLPIVYMAAAIILVYLTGLVDTYRAFKRQLQNNLEAKLIRS